MTVSSIALKTVKALFRNPGRKGANIYEGLPFGIGLGYAGINMYKAIDDIKNNKNIESKKDMMEAYVGMAITAGGIFGIGGAILSGCGAKLLAEKSKSKIA